MGSRQQKTFGVDSSTSSSPVDLETVNENWDIDISEIINKTDSEGDAWIFQRQQPLLTKKLSTKTSSMPTQKSSPKNLSKVARGFVSTPNLWWLKNCLWKLSHCRLQIINETDSKGDVWIRQRPQHLLTEK